MTDPGSRRESSVGLFLPVSSKQYPQFLERVVTSEVLPMLSPLFCLLSPGHFLCTFQTFFLGSFPTLTGWVRCGHSRLCLDRPEI